MKMMEFFWPKIDELVRVSIKKCIFFILYPD